MNEINLNIVGKEELNALLRKGSSGQKLGESIQYSTSDNWAGELKNSSARFVLLGINEDVGIKASHGESGHRDFWWPIVDTLINSIASTWVDGKSLFVLGNLETKKLQVEADWLEVGRDEDVARLGEIITQIDNEVSSLIQKIVALGKIPIVVSGGQNNSLGIIRGVHQALNRAINVVNCSLYSGLEQPENRNSANSFSWALQEKILSNYWAFGVHENKWSASAKAFQHQFSKQVNSLFYESAFVERTTCWRLEIDKVITATEGSIGLELDMESIGDFSGSELPVGIAKEDARLFIRTLAHQLNVSYWHISLGRNHFLNKDYEKQWPLFITYLITDFLARAQKASN